MHARTHALENTFVNWYLHFFWHFLEQTTNNYLEEEFGKLIVRSMFNQRYINLRDNLSEKEKKVLQNIKNYYI